jgi:hypothetical protein
MRNAIILSNLPEVLNCVTEAALEFVMRGLNAAMNKYNGGIES